MEKEEWRNKEKKKKKKKEEDCLVGWLVSQRPHQQLGCIADGTQDCRLTIMRTATHTREWGDHGVCLSLSHYILTPTQPVENGRPQR